MSLRGSAKIDFEDFTNLAKEKKFFLFFKVLNRQS
jgi:hypothetical protein